MWSAFRFAVALCIFSGSSLLACAELPNALITPNKPIEKALSTLPKGSDDPAVNLRIGQIYLAFADTDHWDYLDHAVTFLSKAHQALPDNAEIMMYLGRATGARALRQGPSLLSRLQWAREGFKLMDKALAKDKDCFLLRLYRGEAQIMAHPILRRQNRLEQDAKFLESFIKSDSYSALPGEIKARIQLFMGDYLTRKKNQDARGRNCWQKAADLAAHSTFAQQALARLNGTFEGLGY